MQHPRWREGKLSTGFIAEEYPEGFKPRTARRRGAQGARRRRRRHRPSEQPAPARISQQMSGQRRALRQAPRRPHRRGSSSVVEVRGDGYQARVTFARMPPASRRRRSRSLPTGGPATRSGAARRRQGTSPCRSARSSTAMMLVLSRHPVAGPRLHRARGGDGRADAGEGRGRHVEVPALPDAGARQGDPSSARARR